LAVHSSGLYSAHSLCTPLLSGGLVFLREFNFSYGCYLKINYLLETIWRKERNWMMLHVCFVQRKNWLVISFLTVLLPGEPGQSLRGVVGFELGESYESVARL
jgi:hypothetical protein